MNSEIDEQLSALVDGELAESDQLVNHLQQDSKLRKRWMRYHVMRQVMRNQLTHVPGSEFLDQIKKQLAEEPVVFSPLYRRIQSRGVIKQIAGLAIAASIATVAILTVQTQSIDRAPELAPVTAALPQDGFRLTSERLDADVESKLSNYLVNHNQYSASGRLQGMLLYTRIVSSLPSQRITYEDK